VIVKTTTNRLTLNLRAETIANLGTLGAEITYRPETHYCPSRAAAGCIAPTRSCRCQEAT
jgi:hypothetical protein